MAVEVGHETAFYRVFIGTYLYPFEYPISNSPNYYAKADFNSHKFVLSRICGENYIAWSPTSHYSPISFSAR